MYQHGFVAVPLITAVMQNDAFRQLILNASGDYHSALEVGYRCGFNIGYFKITLRVLDTLGFIKRESSDSFKFLDTTALSYLPSFETISCALRYSWLDFFASGKDVEIACLLIDSLKARWSSISPIDSLKARCASLLDGIVLAPMLIAVHKIIANWDYSTKLFVVESSAFDSKSWDVFVDFWSWLSWGSLTNSSDLFRLTEQGRFLLERCLNMGVATSYWPMLSGSVELLQALPHNIISYDDRGHEQHVDRALNVIGSGAMHVSYFSSLCKMISSIFDDTNFELQPQYIVDMGCGDGNLLKMVYKHIALTTLRGQFLVKFPILMVGIDISEVAREETKKSLSKEGIPHLIIHGDIGDPSRLSSDLYDLGISANILHIRSFLDHDRPFKSIIDEEHLDRRANNLSSHYTGQYVEESGAEKPAVEVVQNLVEHLSRWAAIIGDHGLVALEVHCLEPLISSEYLEMSAGLYFDACQSMSRQWLVEPVTWITAAAEAGLFAHGLNLGTFPEGLPYRRITLARFLREEHQIRPAAACDFKALSKMCPSSATHEFFEAQLSKSLSKKRHGNFVLLKDDEILGAMFTQRIDSTDHVLNAGYEAQDEVENPHGPVLQVVQLIYNNSEQHHFIGNQLTKFILCYATVQCIWEVVAISQPTDFHTELGGETIGSVSNWFFDSSPAVVIRHSIGSSVQVCLNE
jgi:SAM-dependent methyltransferase